MNIIEHNWNWSHGLSSRSATNAIVIHHAAAKTASPEDVHRWHLNNGWAGIGYHLYIRKDGSVHRGRPLWASGAQTLNYNSTTLGICCEGNYDVETAMPSVQLNALREVLRYLKGVYPHAAIKCHRDYNATACPGKYFPLAEALDYEQKPAPAPVPTTAPVVPAEREEDEMQRFKTVDDLPKEYRKGIQKLIDLGKLKGKGGDEGLDLTEDMARVLIVCGRMQGVL